MWLKMAQDFYFLWPLFDIIHLLPLDYNYSQNFIDAAINICDNYIYG